jgi:hypothetical protein
LLPLTASQAENCFRLDLHYNLARLRYTSEWLIIYSNPVLPARESLDIRVIIWLGYAVLTAATQCIVDNGMSPPSPTSSFAEASQISSTPNMTIAITNSYRSQLSLSFGLDMSSPPLYSNPQPTELAYSSSTHYIYPDE